MAKPNPQEEQTNPGSGTATGAKITEILRIVTEIRNLLRSIESKLNGTP